MFLLLNLNHLLVVMLVFEFIGLKILFILVTMFYKNFIFISLIILVLLACEASLGLSLLVGVVRCKYINYVESGDVFIV